MTTKLPIGMVALALACSMGRAAPQPAPSTAPLQRVEEAAFGTMPDGTVVKVYTLANAKGMKARVLSQGGIIAGILAPDKDGKFTNVVACADTFQTNQRFNMQAQTVGRVANRIAGGAFTLDGKDYKTETNNGGNTLHSGAANFGLKVWEGKPLAPKDHEGSAQLTYVSKDGEGGFPGNLTVKVTYTLTDDNEFRLDYEATTDKSTPLNILNHAYFNLAGAIGWGNAAGVPIAEQELWIDADKTLVNGPGLIPTGQFAPVKDTPLDFTKPTALGARAAQQRSYDNAYVLNSGGGGGGGGGKLALVARLRDPKSGREMEVRTDQPGLQLYTGQPTGVALETQHHPDSIHRDNFPTTVLKPGATFKSTTIYAFSAK